MAFIINLGKEIFPSVLLINRFTLWLNLPAWKYDTILTQFYGIICAYLKKNASTVMNFMPGIGGLDAIFRKRN